jgi:hypothetical protein
MFEGMGSYVETLIVICVISVPLGLWKLIEIIIWLCKHIHLSFS